MAGRALAVAEPLVLLAAAPLLLFPTSRPAWTVVALALLAAVWVLRAAFLREFWPASPANLALLVFCLAIPLAVWASAFPELTLPKLTGLILGLASLRVLGFAVRSRRSLAIGLAVFGIVALGVWAVGLLGMRLAPLQGLTARLPQALVALPGTPGEGVNPNQLAGALVLALPVMLGCAAGCAREGRRSAVLLLAAAMLVLLATVIFTRSRAGWIGLSVALIAWAFLAAWSHGSRRLRLALGTAAGLSAVAVVAAAVMVGPSLVARVAETGQGSPGMDAVMQQLSLDARVEIWSRAVYALQDFPFTGVGLGTFRRVVNLLYPLFLVPPDSDIAHAHNLLLQVGVDLGLGGLVGYVALMLAAAVTAWRAARSSDRFAGSAALGLLAGMIGLHVYGLADTLALGSKPGLLFWLALGLMVALPQVDAGLTRAGERPDRRSGTVAAQSNDAV